MTGDRTDIFDTVILSPDEIAEQFLKAPTVKAARNFGSDLPPAMEDSMRAVADLSLNFNSFVEKYSKVVELMDSSDPVAARHTYFEINHVATRLAEKTTDASEACWDAINRVYAAARAINKITAHFGDNAKARVVEILKQNPVALIDSESNQKVLDTVGAMTEAYDMKQKIDKIRTAAMEKAYPPKA